MDNFKDLIAPFSWLAYDGHYSLCLNAGDFKDEIFEVREDTEGNGYDWEALAIHFINENMPELDEVIEFDSEAGMFCAYSVNEQMLARFAVEFRKICDDDATLKNLVLNMELV